MCFLSAVPQTPKTPRTQCFADSGAANAEGPPQALHFQRRRKRTAYRQIFLPESIRAGRFPGLCRRYVVCCCHLCGFHLLVLTVVGEPEPV